MNLKTRKKLQASLKSHPFWYPCTNKFSLNLLILITVFKYILRVVVIQKFRNIERINKMFLIQLLYGALRNCFRIFHGYLFISDVLGLIVSSINGC